MARVSMVIVWNKKPEASEREAGIVCSDPLFDETAWNFVCLQRDLSKTNERAI